MQASRSGKIITFLTLVLVVFGLVVLSSAGVVEGQKKFGSAYYYLTHQLLYGVLPGLALFFIFSRINYKVWRKLALPILIIAVGLLVLVFVPATGFGLKGAQRWLDFRFFTFQPSEFLKLALVVYLAAWFSKREGHINDGPSLVVPFFLVLAFIGLLLILQPDMGTLALITIIAIAMYFFAGAKISHFLIMFLVLGVLLGALAVVAPYRFDRIKAFFDPTRDTQGTSYHINQALIGIGSGGIFGLGYGQSKQKFNYLPEPVGDSIFAVLVEELGFVGGVFLVALFVLFALTMISIAKNSSSQFGRMVILGITTWVSAQAFINIASISGLIPLTGIPLPFVSFGSSSLLSLLSGLGIAVNISRYS
jgi:cell division protein FtsW